MLTISIHTRKFIIGSFDKRITIKYVIADLKRLTYYTHFITNTEEEINVKKLYKTCKILFREITSSRFNTSYSESYEQMKADETRFNKRDCTKQLSDIKTFWTE